MNETWQWAAESDCSLSFPWFFFFWTQNSYLLRYSNVFFMIPLAFSLQYSTGTRSNDIRLERKPVYNGQFCLSRQKAHIFSIKLTRLMCTPVRLTRTTDNILCPESHILRLFICALSMTEYLINENLTVTANYPSKVLSYVQPTWLSRKLKPSVQSEVAGRIIRTVWHVPLVSVLTRWHCNYLFSDCPNVIIIATIVSSLFVIAGLWSAWRPWTKGG